MANSILTPGQRKLLNGLMVLAAFMVGNAAYLSLSKIQKSVLPTFYQWMLVTHVVVGLILLFAVIIAGLVWFTANTAKRVEALLPPRGQFMDIDGQRIHYTDTGGTKPDTSPPCDATSFTNRELTNDCASLAIRNMVSISGRSRRFISAACSSYS